MIDCYCLCSLLDQILYKLKRIRAIEGQKFDIRSIVNVVEYK